MGLVLQVTHLQLGEQLALKVLSPEGVATPELHARFLREAQAVVRLRGEHVARVSDVGVLPDGTPYMVMEYLRGLDLAAELERRGRLFPGEAVDYILQACEALAEAHATGVVHRDIKPANLFLTTRPDGTPLVKVLDFGISKAPVNDATRLTRTDTVMGTSGYMSPEQMKASKDVDARTDIWALGIVLYECLNGRRPFGGESFLAVAMMASTEPPPPMEAWVSRPLQGVVLRCLEKDRNDRYASIAALVAALAPFARDRRTAAVVVDRANLLRQARPPDSELELAARSGQSPTATTLSGSARALRAGSPSRRRRTIAGVFALLGSVTLLSLAALLATGRLNGFSGHSEPESGDTADAADGVRPEGEARSLAECAGLAAQNKWRELAECATKLAELGLTDQANEFRAKATREAQNEAADGKVRQAIRDGNLKEAQALLRGVTEDSVYRRPLNELFDRADAANVEDAVQRSQELVNAHDCAGLKLYLEERRAGAKGTERAITVVEQAIARCTPKFVPRPAAGKPGGKASAKPAIDI